MKQLTLIRHAKSDWETGLGDHERPLNPRGLRDAPEIGKELAQRKFMPDLIRSSDAVRAMTTARMIAKEIGYPEADIESAPEIYLASTNALLLQVQQLDEGLQSVVLFGHNPGFECLADLLLGSSAVDRMVTCAVVRMNLDVEHWGLVSENSASLVEFLYPKML